MNRRNTDHPRDRDYRIRQRHNANSPKDSHHSDDPRASIYDNPRDRDYRDNINKRQNPSKTRDTDDRDQHQNSNSARRHHDYSDHFEDRRLEIAQAPEKGLIVVHARDAPIFDEFAVDDVVVDCVGVDGVVCFLFDDSPPEVLGIASNLQETGIRGRDILLKVNDKDIGNPYPGKVAIAELLRKSNLPLKLTFVKRDFIGKYLPSYRPPSRLLDNLIDDRATIVANILNVRLAAPPPAHIQFPYILNVKNFAGDPLFVVAKTEADLLYPNFIIKCAHALKSLVSLLTGIEMSDTESPTDEEGNLNPKVVLTKNSIIDVEKEYRIVEAARDFNEKTKNWKTELCDTELMKPENEIFLAEWIHFRCFEQLEMKNYRPVIMSRRHSILTAKLCEYGELDKLKYEVSLPAFPCNTSPAFDYVEKHNIISDLLYDDGYYFEQEDDDWILLSRGPQRHAGGDNLEIWRRCTWAARTCFMMLLHTRIGISHNQIWAWLNIFQPRNGKTLLDWTGNTLLDLRLNLNGHRASHLKWFSRDAAIEASMITRDRMNFSSMTPPRNVGRDYLQNRRKAEQQRCSYEYGQNHSPKNSLEGPKRALFRRMTETIRHTEQVDTFFEYHDVTDAFYDDAPEFKDTDCDSELRQLPTVNLVAVDPPNFYENWDNPMFINLLNFLHCHLEVPHAHSFSAALAIGTEGCWPSSDTAKCVAQQAVWMRKFLRPKKEILYEHSISMDTRLTQEKRLGFDHSMLTDFRVLRSIRELQRSNKVWKVVSQEKNSSCWSINPKCIKNAKEKNRCINDLVELYRHALRKISPVTEGRRRAVVGVQLSNGSMMSGELCWECY